MKRASQSDLDKLLEPARKQRGKAYQHTALANVNKSALIREWRSKNPEATPAEIVEGLGLGGVLVTRANVYQALSADKAKSGKPELGKAALGELQKLIKAKRAAEAMGGIEAAREALAAYAKLVE